MNIETRTLAYMIAEALFTAGDRIVQIAQAIESGEADPAALRFVKVEGPKEDGVLAGWTVDRSTTPPTLKRTSAPDYDLSGIVRKPARKSAADTTPAPARPPRYAGNYPKKQKTENRMGRPPVACCGKKMNRGYKMIDGERINYRFCDACKMSNFERILAIHNAKKRVEARRGGDVA